jgi:hypothetical protein
MEMEKYITDEVQKRQLIWFEHTNRMYETRWRGKVLKWVSQEERKRRRSRRSWGDNIKEAMEARDLEEECCRMEE